MAAWRSRYKTVEGAGRRRFDGWRCIVSVLWSRAVEDRAGTVREGAGTGLEGRVRHGSLKYTQKHAVAVEL